MKLLLSFVLLTVISQCSAFSSPFTRKISLHVDHKFSSLNAINELPSDKNVYVNVAPSQEFKELSHVSKQDNSHFLMPLALLSPLMLMAQPADAITTSVSLASDSSNALPSAFAAYGHYLGLVLISATLAAERLLIKPNMSEEDEKLLVYADSLYGISGVLVLITGYFRATQFGKGWEFYSHEPIFWVKMFLLAVMGSSSLFPTIKIVQRAIESKEASEGKRDPPAPLSPKLAARMIKVVNGELLAVASIPLAASLMSRGVGYADWFPWQAGAGLVALAVGGLGFKYTKEALTWQE